MSLIQRLFTAVLPRGWSASMEAESREWLMTCPCGAEQSVWDAGGIRWKAAGNPQRRLKCNKCHQVTLHTIHRVKDR